MICEIEFPKSNYKAKCNAIKNIPAGQMQHPEFYQR